MTTKATRYLGELAAMNARQDTARHRADDSQFVAVDFKKLVIHPKVMAYQWWEERGYRLFKGCMPVRTDYINEHADVFSVFADKRG